MNILKLSFLIIFFIIGCSSNEKILKDSRPQITKAAEWELNFVPKDSGSGIIFQFIRDKNIIGVSKHINMLLWAYPLDTVVVEKKVYDEIQPMPSGGIADVTYIYYKVKNDTIKISSIIDSTNQITKDVLPNKYLLLINSYGYSPMYLRDIRVVDGYWSIIKISMYEPGIELH
jgi:hypothetical protein